MEPTRGSNNFFRQNDNISPNRKMKITFIGNDVQWLGTELPSNIEKVFLDSTSSNTTKPVDTEGLLVYIHDWTVGRLEPHLIKEGLKLFKEKHGRKIDAVLVLCSPNAQGIDTALVGLKYELENDDIKLDYTRINRQKINIPDRKKFLDLINDWYSNRKIEVLRKASPKESTDTNQEKRIADLEEQVRQLSERLLATEKLLGIESKTPASPTHTTNLFWGLFGKK